MTIFLPEAEIQYIAVDNEATQVLDRSTGLFTQGDPRLETDARQVAEEVLLNQALETGIIDDATENAIEVLTNFLLGLGYTDVRVEPEYLSRQWLSGSRVRYGSRRHSST